MTLSVEEFHSAASAARMPDAEAFARRAAVQRGWSCFPLTPFSKVPLAGSRGHHDATTDVDELGDLFARGADLGVCNAAVKYGPSGLIVVEDDGHGDVRLEELLDLLGLDGDTYRIRARRGDHLLFDAGDVDPAELRTVPDLMGFELRCGENYSVLPGSVVAHVDGAGVRAEHIYCEVDPDAPIRRASDDLVEAVLRRKKTPAIPAGPRSRVDPQTHPAGTEEIVQRVIAAKEPDTSRHSVILPIVHALMREGYTESDVHGVAEEIAGALCDLEPQARRIGAEEVQRSIEYAFTTGERSDLLQLVSRIDAYASRLVRHRAGSEGRVLDALVYVAMMAGEAEAACDLRRLGLIAGVSKTTAARAAKKLEKRSWIVRMGTNEQGTTIWRLCDPASTAALAGNGTVREQLYVVTAPAPTVPLPANRVLRAGLDAFRHGALGSTGREVMLALAAGPLTLEEIAQRLVRAPRTARRHLDRLARLELVQRTENGLYALPPVDDLPGLLDRAAQLLAVAGRGTEQADRHNTERRTDAERRRIFGRQLRTRKGNT